MTYPSFGDSTGLFPIYLAETVEETIAAASNAFAFTETAEHNYFFEDITDDLGLTDLVQLEAFTVLAADRLFFFGAYAPGGQDVQHNYFFEDTSNEFAFADVSGYDQELDIVQYLNFTPRYFAPDLFNSFSFRNETFLTTGASASNSFAWLDHDDTEDDVWPRALYRTYNVGDTMALASVVAGGDEQNVYDVIGFADEADSSGSTYERDAGELGLKDTVTFKITGSKCVEKEFSPYVGAGTDGFPTFSATAPTLGSGVLTLTYPRVGPSLTLVLKNPTFGNVDSLAYPKIDRTTRGGERVLFSDPDWGSSQVLTMTVENICDPDIDELLTFLNTSLGKEIGLLDWEGRTWAGVIMAPQTDITKTVSGWRLQLTFEGELA